MSSDHHLVVSGRKLSGLHGLRAVAAIAIVFFHLKNIAALSVPSTIAPIVDHLYLSVQLFFVLSAYSLFHSHTFSPVPLTNYLWKRFFRIAPLFYAMILFQTMRGGFPGWGAFLANILFVFNLFPDLANSINWAGWSVGVEMIFYILLPGMLYVSTKSYKQRGVFALFTLLSALLSVLVWHLCANTTIKIPQYFAYFSVFSNLTPFCAGLFAYGLYQRLESGGRIPRNRQLLIIVFISSLAFSFLDPLNLHAIIPGLYFASWSIPFSSLCLWQSLYPSRVLQRGAIQWLADRSFSIYLLHPVVIEYCKPVYKYLGTSASLDSGWLYAASMVVTLLVLLVLANVTFLLIELPGIEFGRHCVSISRSSLARYFLGFIPVSTGKKK